MAESAPPACALRLDKLSFTFGRMPVLSGVGLQLEPGTFFSMLGPSGGGKTTLLRLIGGYLQPSSGRVFLNERDVTALPPERRDMGMVFQSYALFPHLTARENVAFGLQMRRVPREECRRRVEDMLDRVGLQPQERGRRPAQLSGGQQQRVALARALVIEPDLLLLDEPLASLDRQLREQMRGELKDLQKRSGVTALLVTHDREEAMSLADRIGVLAGGKLLQAGPPLQVYNRPCCAHVARLLGDASFFVVEAIEEDRLRLQGGLSCGGAPEREYRVGSRLMVRPEHCLLHGRGKGWPGIIQSASYLGSDWMLDVAVGTGLSVRVRQRAGGGRQLLPGDPVAVEIPAEAFWPLPEQDPGRMDSPARDEARAIL